MAELVEGSRPDLFWLPLSHSILSWSWVKARYQELRQQPLPSCRRPSCRQRPRWCTWPATAPPAAAPSPGSPPSPHPRRPELLWHRQPTV